MFLAVNIRTQLSLFVPRAISAELEAARALLDPIQASLIPAHVTLCREDELEGLALSLLRSRLAAPETAITLRFGHPQPFQEHGVLLPCVAGEPDFAALRQRVLGTKNIRRQAPHITLAHPRNPKSPHNHPANLAGLPGNLVITFSIVSRIQQEGAAPWQLLEEFPLAHDPPVQAAPDAHALAKTPVSGGETLPVTHQFSRR